MIQEMELIYKSPHSMRKPEGAVVSLEIDGFQGIREYMIKANLNLNTVGGKDGYLILRVNKDGVGDSYSSIEHIYGRMGGKNIHMTQSRPGGIRGGLLMGRTHATKRSNINIESKIYTLPSYPQIALQTVSPNLIISNHDNWILEDVSSIHASKTQEIKNMLIYSSPPSKTSPPGKFYGYLKIYRIIEE